MTDLITNVPEWNPEELPFGETFLGQIFSDCLTGNIQKYGVSDAQYENTSATNLADYIWPAELDEAIKSKSLTVTLSTTHISCSNKTGKIGLGNTPFRQFLNMHAENNLCTYTLREDEDTTTALYCIRHIGLPIISAMSEWLTHLGMDFKEIVHYSNNLPLYIRQIVSQYNYSYNKYIAESALGGNATVMLINNPQILSGKTPAERAVCITNIAKAIHYLLNWLEAAKVAFEKKRQELYTTLHTGDYAIELSRKTMEALEVEAVLTGCEVSQLPQYTADSIARAVRRDNPSHEQKNVHLLTLQALAPYVEASCKVLLEKVAQFEVR